MKIVFHPKSLEKNIYPDILVKQFEKNKIEVYSLDQMFKSFKSFKEINIVHLNWYENLGKVYKSPQKFLRLFLLIVFRKRIIITHHNRVSHSKSWKLINKFLNYVLYNFSEKIIIHSNLSKEILNKIDPKLSSKIVYIPHPNYINQYGFFKNDIQNKYSKSLNLLFLGIIKPYKNIELLLDAISKFEISDVNLTIAGHVSDKAYREKLGSLSVNSNVNLDLNFISNSQLIKYIKESDLLILPYDVRSSLNSGTVILAFSYATSVICPMIGTIMDLKNKDCIISYTYRSTKEHLFKIESSIEKAIFLKNNQPKIFEEWGDTLKSEMEINNNPEMIANNLINVYLNLNK